ncbi:MAG TPA: hypothetical protein PKM88_09775 [bacterium]|nr:hypothetical protein [bacterium]
MAGRLLQMPLVGGDDFELRHFATISRASTTRVRRFFAGGGRASVLDNVIAGHYLALILFHDTRLPLTRQIPQQFPMLQ